MTRFDELLRDQTRRTFLKSIGYGIGAASLQTILAEQLYAAPQAVGRPGAKAKRVICLFMAGAPSQMELFDYKPYLQKHDGELCPEEFLKGERFAFIRGRPKLLGPRYAFERVGKSGQWVSELLPHFKTIVDEVAIVRSMQTDQFNHAPAQLFMNTGFQLPGRPSLGAWLSYGLGTLNRDLPSFVVLLSGLSAPDCGKSGWGSGFLPTVHQGVEFRSSGDPVLFVKNPDGVDDALRRASLDALGDLNRTAHAQSLDPEIETRIAQYELAYRMQTSVPELMDLKGETPATLEMYGAKPGDKSFANNCLLARRLVERGVRFVQLYHRGWDHHGTGTGDDLGHNLPERCRETDQPAAALIKDLKQRGLLEDTLVVWCGEFGRTPMMEARGGNATFAGRDHHPRAFSIWLAGGGIKAGASYGETDDLGYNVASGAMHVNDLHATILHQLGIDHTKLTFKHMGRNFRLTDVAGTVVRELVG